ncbi:hypothetical protein GW17_00002348 [Ensete ventricosum]|nr:hypothetical protein GW17_00002348 [Ensete ventricosum]
MFKYVELCVDMRKGRFAKDGLIQYRITCQQVNVSSLEEVIKYFMQLSTEKAEQARTQAQALEDALDVEDLEVDKRPEDLMLSYVSGEKGKDRSDRELVTPWFKFLWETYRTVLEILRNNSKLESLYAYKDQRDRPDLTAPESLQLYLDTRIEQLKIATDLELWQVSQVYQSITIGTLSKMIPFFDFSLVEKLSVDAVKYNFLSMKVDHLKGAVLFGNLEAQALLFETQKVILKMFAILQEKVTKQTLIELALSEQLKERQELEKKLQKLAKTMDYMERAKREEEAQLIEQAFQQRLVEEKIFHEHEQLVYFV